MNHLLLDLLAFGAILSSILVITSKNPVIAVIFLISVFLNSACYLIVSGLGFLGLSYVIVYVGAITVLFLFVIMMINIKLTDILEVGYAYTKNLPLAVSVGGLFVYELFNIIPFTYNNVSILNLPLNLFNYINEFIFSSNVDSNINGFNLLNNYIFTAESAGNSNVADSIFNNFLQIEVLGQGLYTYGAIWLITTSLILLLSMIAPIILSRNLNN
jgi:NADH-ubiquinone oxidoreductase chain 6